MNQGRQLLHNYDLMHNMLDTERLMLMLDALHVHA